MAKNRKVKIKIRKAIAKRFRVTKTGKLMRRGAQNRHLKANRSHRNARRSRVMKEVPQNIAKKLKKLLAR